MRRTLDALALVAAAVFLASPIGAQAPAVPGRGVAPAFEARSVAGERIALGELAAKGPVVLDFWATWCKPCLMSLPELERLAAKHRADGVTVVAISIDGPRNQAKVRAFANKLGLTMPIVVDRDESLQSAYQVKAVPTTFLIGRDGRIAWSRQGYLPGDADALERELARTLAAAAPAAGTTP